MDIHKIFQTLIEKLKDTENRIKDNIVFEEIVSVSYDIAMSNYEQRLIVTGVGKNANLAAKASETYMSLGIPSFYGNTCHMSHGDFGCIGPNDVVIHLSRSGKTIEMVNAANHIASIRPNVKQYLICCKEQGSIDEYTLSFTGVLYLGDVVEFDENNLAPTTSTSVMLTVLDTIGVIVSSKINFTRKEFYSYHPGGSLGSMLKKEDVDFPLNISTKS